MSRNIIVLNGPSSAGKTSLTKALQSHFDAPYLHLSIDAFWDMLPKGAPEGSAHFPNLKHVFIDTARSLADHGHDVIIDTVFSPETLQLLKTRLSAHKAFYVAVSASLPVLLARQNERCDREGKVEAQHATIPGDSQFYDLTLDTSDITPQQGAEKILHACKLG